MKKVYILLIILCILNALDYATTMLAIGGGAVEGNPVADIFISHNALHYFKLVGVGLLCVYLIHAAKRDAKSLGRVTKVLWGANAFYGLVVVSNFVVYHFGI